MAAQSHASRPATSQRGSRSVQALAASHARRSPATNTATTTTTNVSATNTNSDCTTILHYTSTSSIILRALILVGRISNPH